MKKEIVTIAGNIGSGKSSTAKRVAAALGYEHFSSGDIFRKIAAERGLSVEEINATAELEKEIDHETDRRLREIGEFKSRLVIDSRLAWYWIPHSFKVFLELDRETAAERIYQQLKTEGRVSQSASSIEEVLEKIDERLASEQKRYMNLYGIDITNTTPFDLVIDTAQHDLEQVTEQVLLGYREWFTP